MSDKTCQRCQSRELVVLGAKHSDGCYVGCPNDESIEYFGYGLSGFPWCLQGTDYINFTVCLTCGQMQGTWGLTLDKIRAATSGE